MSKIKINQEPVLGYKEYVKSFYNKVDEQVAATTEPSSNGILADYTNDTQARSNITSVINSDASYSSLFKAIVSYWTKQIPLLKNKPKDQLTPEETSMMDTIESKLKNGDSKSIEDYAMTKILGEHSKEITYQKDKKTIAISGYTETDYDKTIKTK